MFKRGHAIIAAAVLCAAPMAMANPYAGEVNVSGTSGSFYLNEPADSITISYDNGASTQVIDGSTAGLKSFTLPSSGSTFSIKVTNSSAAGYTTVGSAPDPVLTDPGTPPVTAQYNFGPATVLQVGATSTQFGTPRGIAVNNNGNDGSNFGRVYVSNAGAGGGIFSFNSDMTGGLGGGASGPSNGGIAFTGSSSSPWRIQVGADSKVYISDFADSNGNLFRLNPDLTSPAGGNTVFANTGGSSPLPAGQNHGNPIAFGVTGTEAAGNLRVVTFDEDYVSPSGGTANNLLRYDINGPIPAGGYAILPTVLADNPEINPASADIAVASNGNIYLTQNRSAGTDAFSMRIYKPDGTQIYDSLTASQDFETPLPAGADNGDDLLRSTWSMAISPDDKYIALGGSASPATIKIVPLLADGTPDFAHGGQFDAFDVGFLRDLSFDSAGNLYAVCSGTGEMKIFSPGGDSSWVTSFDGQSYSFGPAVVPEPASLALLGLGGLGLLRRRRRA